MSTSSPSIPTTVHSARELRDDERALLLELFKATPNGAVGINALAFRVKHGREKQLIRTLESEELIRSEGEKYFISLPAILALGTGETLNLLAEAEDVYASLRVAFEADPQKPVLVSTLAASTRLSEESTRRTLSYMLESTTVWIRSSPVDVLNQADAALLMSEGVQDYETFRAVIGQLDEWRMNRLHQRATGDWSEAFGLPAGASSPAEGAAPSPVPAWIKKLPPTMSQVMTEVYSAVGAGLRTLPAIGFELRLTCTSQMLSVATSARSPRR